MITPLRSSLRRRTTAASAALLLGLALTACGGGDGDAGDDPSPRASDSESTGTPSATSTPDAPSTSADTGEPPAEVPSEQELEAALLTPADVPDGFAPSPDDGDDDEGGFQGTCLADVGKFKDAYGAEPDEEAEVDLESETPTGQAAVTSQVEAYADVAKLTPAFASFTDQLQTCTSVEATEDGVAYALKIAYDDTVDLPGADDQLAFDVTGTIGSGEQTYPVAYRFVVALAGQFVSIVGAYTIGDDTTGVVDSTADLAATQAERVAELG
jgi:hypothetical protein